MEVLRFVHIVSWSTANCQVLSVRKCYLIGEKEYLNGKDKQIKVSIRGVNFNFV